MKPGPLAVAVALAAFLVVRRRKLEPTLLIGGALAVVGFAVYGSGVVELPNIEKLIEDAGSALGAWTYAIVAVAAFVETGAFVGLIAPGETFMVFGGVVAGQGRIDIVALIGLVWAAAVAGDFTSFYLGRRLGRQFLVRHGPKFSITEDRLRTVEAFFDRHGGKAILLGRFIGLVRAIAPFLAGSSGMPFRRFVPYDVIGAGLWATTFLMLGYIFWQRFGDVLNYAEKGAFALGTTIVTIVVVVWLVRRLRDPQRRRQLADAVDRALDRPALRPVGRVLRPVWRGTQRPRRFVWQRLTPGELGLEVTTLAAVLAVGSYVFIAGAVTVTEVGVTAGDRRTLGWADDLYDPTLVDVVKVVTALGSPAVVGIAVALTSVFIAVRRRFLEAGLLLAGLLLVWVAVNLAKEEIERPGPTRPLVEAAGNAYPSAQAAYAVLWVAIAIVVSRSLPGIARTTAMVIAALVVAAVAGATRVYLRVQYLSDVVGGYGLAASVLALLVMAVLFVVHVRNNESRT